MTRSFQLALISILALLALWAGPAATDAQPRFQGRSRLQAFDSTIELRRFLGRHARAYERRLRREYGRARMRRGDGEGYGSVQAEASAAPPSPATSAPAQAQAPADDRDAEESVTNNQVAGVDEGGIVKTHGDHLVILRRGRLFTVRVGDESLTPVDRIDVFPPGARADSWYDEMLVHDDQVIVIGYRYETSATELGFFSIDRHGRLRYRKTYYLRSNDYYSSRNYASRLVGDTLVFYMPYGLIEERWDDEPRVVTSLPSMRTHGEDGWSTIVRGNRVFYPIQSTESPVLHTVVRCNLRSAPLSCDASGVIGPWGRHFFVSQQAVYVWVDGEDAHSVVYRLPLDGSEPGAVRAEGAPTDQFSFEETSDRFLQVLIRSEGGGEGMWGAEVTSGDVALLRLPLSRFSTDVPEAGPTNYTRLPRPERGSTFQNRFVGSHVLYGTGTSWGYHNGDYDPHVFVHPVRGGQTATVPLGHGVDRIEVMGRDAVVVGSDGSSLVFSAIAFDGVPRVAGRYAQAGAAQGETRSHGFFFRPTSATGGLLGLPVQEAGNPGFAHLVQGSASVLFLRVDDREFTQLGSLGAQDRNPDDHCLVSCVDWYGNARPLFLRNRVFALLGYEIVEGRVTDGGGLTEVRRINFIPAIERRGG